MKLKRMERKKIGRFFLLALVLVLIPMVGADEINISINISSPEEGDVFFHSDAIPPYLAIMVLGVVDTPYGLQNVTITNSIHETICGFTHGNHSSIRCQVQSEVGDNQIVITVRDKQGNIARIIRNYSFKLDQHGPPEITSIFIHGKVTDTAGRALSGVAVVIEPLSNPPNREDYVKITTTHENGTYTIEDGVPFGFDYERNISAKKEGYEPIKKKITIKYGNQTHEQNFILTPQNKALSGIDSPLGLCAIFICLLIISVRKW